MQRQAAKKKSKSKKRAVSVVYKRIVDTQPDGQLAAVTVKRDGSFVAVDVTKVGGDEIHVPSNEFDAIGKVLGESAAVAAEIRTDLAAAATSLRSAAQSLTKAGGAA